MSKASVKVSVKQVDHGWNALMQMNKNLKNRDSYVKVGVLDDGKGAEDRGGLTNAQIAAIHEFGAPEAGIPERSFVRSTFTEKKPEYVQLLKKLLNGLYQGKFSVAQVLELMGMRVAADIKNKVTAGEPIPPPNEPATIARKGSERPLIDTGRMINSLSWAVVMKGNEKK